MQIEERSHKIWGGEAGLEEEHRNKIERREKKKEKKYAKEIKRERATCMFVCACVHVHNYVMGEYIPVIMHDIACSCLLCV